MNFGVCIRYVMWSGKVVTNTENETKRDVDGTDRQCFGKLQNFGITSQSLCKI
jgi:hypothetical protein